MIQIRFAVSKPQFEKDVEIVLADLMEREIEGTIDVKNYKDIKEVFSQKVLAARKQNMV